MCFCLHSFCPAVPSLLLHGRQHTNLREGPILFTTRLYINKLQRYPISLRVHDNLRSTRSHQRSGKILGYKYYMLFLTGVWNMMGWFQMERVVRVEVMERIEVMDLGGFYYIKLLTCFGNVWYYILSRPFTRMH